ncbi:endonuclease domain-containing protein [Pseudooceanicola sp.]|uniref:endonuclease domain-containing protein n=1 Tax=Pseudooceanicola sp. TaxID=1914328 RepID=UPI0035C710CC
MSGFRSARQKQFAKALRSTMTEEEKILWYHLRAHRFMGLSVRRQAPVGPYIVDFLIPSRRLILEADGAHHTTTRDATRDAHLAALGYRTLRLSNHDIRTNLPGVLARVAEEAQR